VSHVARSMHFVSYFLRYWGYGGKNFIEGRCYFFAHSGNFF
jgi:hypothetical protein